MPHESNTVLGNLAVICKLDKYQQFYQQTWPASANPANIDRLDQYQQPLPISTYSDNNNIPDNLDQYQQTRLLSANMADIS